MDKFTLSLIVVDSMFDRYTLIVDPANKSTSVYCEYCEEWVAEFDGSVISQHSQEELYEKILTTHHDDDDDDIVFNDSIETFL